MQRRPMSGKNEPLEPPPLLNEVEEPDWAFALGNKNGPNDADTGTGTGAARRACRSPLHDSTVSLAEDVRGPTYLDGGALLELQRCASVLGRGPKHAALIAKINRQVRAAQARRAVAARALGLDDDEDDDSSSSNNDNNNDNDAAGWSHHHHHHRLVGGYTRRAREYQAAAARALARLLRRRAEQSLPDVVQFWNSVQDCLHMYALAHELEGLDVLPGTPAELERLADVVVELYKYAPKMDRAVAGLGGGGGGGGEAGADGEGEETDGGGCPAKKSATSIEARLRGLQFVEPEGGAGPVGGGGPRGGLPPPTPPKESHTRYKKPTIEDT